MYLKWLVGAALLSWTYVLNNWTNSFPRNENANPDMFWTVVCLTGIVAGLTLKTSEKDEMCSRHQTDEWKGFMQIVFLLYHYYRATFVYNEIRVFVSCYVWMTGFGNYLYFTKKKDFSRKRVIGTLIRINLLTICLMLIHQTPMMLYYVVPLHTVFFGVTYVTCWIIERTQRPLLVLFSTLCVLILVFECIPLPWSHEMNFRFGLDKYSAWIGMMCAWAVTRISKTSVWGGVMGSALIIIWYIFWGSNPDKYIYNRIFCFYYQKTMSLK